MAYVGARGDGWWVILDSTDPDALLDLLVAGPHPTRVDALAVLTDYRTAAAAA